MPHGLTLHSFLLKSVYKLLYCGSGFFKTKFFNELKKRHELKKLAKIKINKACCLFFHRLFKNDPLIAAALDNGRHGGAVAVSQRPNGLARFWVVNGNRVELAVEHAGKLHNVLVHVLGSTLRVA